MADPLQGEVYYWPAIEANHSMGDRKTHRWVIVSRNAFNSSSEYILACPLTSYPPTALDIAVSRTPHNRLDHDSALLPRMITPILKAELADALTQLPPQVTRQVLDKIRMIIEVD